MGILYHNKLSTGILVKIIIIIYYISSRKFNIKINYMEQKKLKKKVCKLCKYQWIPKVVNPRQCPNCKRQIKYEKK